MKRKVIQLAERTMVVSLPAAWARKQGISKGDTVQVEERGGGLVIHGSDHTPAGGKAKVDVSGVNTSVAWYYLTAAYVKGCEEIEVLFDGREIPNPRTGVSSEPTEFIRCLVDDLPGMEIAYTTKRSVLIREVAVPKVEEYQTILRRMFFLLISLTKEMGTGDPEKRRLLIAKQERRLNSLAHLCLRIASRLSDRSQDLLVIHELEKIGDALTRSGHTLSVKQINELHGLLKVFHEAFYTGTREALMKFHSARLGLGDDAAPPVREAAENMMECLAAKLVTCV